jgi:hypothetical protein
MVTHLSDVSSIYGGPKRGWGCEIAYALFSSLMPIVETWNFVQCFIVNFRCSYSWKTKSKKCGLPESGLETLRNAAMSFGGMCIGGTEGSNSYFPNGITRSHSRFYTCLSIYEFVHKVQVRRWLLSTNLWKSYAPWT